MLLWIQTETLNCGTEQMIGNEHVCTLSAMSSHPHGWSFMNIQKAINRQCLQIGYHRKEFYLFIPKCYKNISRNTARHCISLYVLNPPFATDWSSSSPSGWPTISHNKHSIAFLSWQKESKRSQIFNQWEANVRCNPFPMNGGIVTSSHPTPSVSFCSSIL